MNTQDIEARTTATLRASGCVFAEDEAALLISESTSPAELATMIRQRVSGLPLEHILGWAEFCGLRIAVGPGVFVPRRRTEFLVQKAAALTNQHDVVLDLGCGSGALAAAIANRVGDIKLHATDIEHESLIYARRNLKPFGGHVYQGDLFAPLPTSLRGRINTLVANMPYVPTGAIEFLPTEARLHEPPITLDGGPDGLDIHRRVAAQTPDWLAPGGNLLIETSDQQANPAVAILTLHGLKSHITRDQMLDATVIIATMPSKL